MQNQIKAKSTKLHKESGIALVSALVFLVITVIFVGTSLVVSASNRRLSADNVRIAQAQFIAEAGIERVIYDIWHTDPDESNKRSLEQFRKRLNELGIAAGEDDTDAFKFGPSKIYQSDVQPQNSENVKDAFSTGGYELSVRRIDIGSSRTTLRLDVTAFVGDKDNPWAERRITEDINIQLPELPGFALLTNNANCIFCHTNITSLEVAYDDEGNYHPIHQMVNSSTDRERYILDQYRVKVGALEHLVVDRDTAEMQSLLFGTIYTRGTTNLLDARSTLRGIPFQDDSPRLSSDSPTQFSETDCAFSCNERHQTFYTNYPSFEPPDGDLPDRFPLPAIDANEDRIISHSEWADAIGDSRDPGRIKGGAVKRFNETVQSVTDNNSFSAVTRGELLDRTLVELDSKSSTRGIGGNLILKGTKDKPLVIEGSVYVDGDVVISGYVTGNGRLISRGNIYVVGDMLYRCDINSQDYEFSSAQDCNYGKPLDLPQFALVAGKNIMIGPYMMQHLATTRQGVYPVPSNHLSGTGLPADNQDEMYRWFIDPGYWPENENGEPLRGAHRDYGERDASYTMSFSHVEIALFNQLEYEKAASEVGYVPRYYTMRDSETIYRCTSTGSPGCRYYGNTDYVDDDSANETNPDLIQLSADELNGATVIALTPTSGWLTSLGSTEEEIAQASELEIRQMWLDEVENTGSLHDQSNLEALQVDAILYSSNAVFALAPEKSAIEGKMRLHGSLVAADTGILVPGVKNEPNRHGLTILYDDRLSRFLDIKDDKDIIQIRSNFRLLETDSTLNLYPDVSKN